MRICAYLTLTTFHQMGFHRATDHNTTICTDFLCHTLVQGWHREEGDHGAGSRKEVSLWVLLRGVSVLSNEVHFYSLQYQAYVTL